MAERIADQRTDTLLLLEHPPVYTLGRNSLREHILVSREELARRGATVERIERGGEVTYHGPGQLVAYPIIKLQGAERSISRLVDNLEQAIIDTLAGYGITGERLPDQRGVWAGGCKIASVGLSVKRWVVMHGMALNVDMDMSYFTLINPCGHPETVMTSMKQILGRAPASTRWEPSSRATSRASSSGRPCHSHSPATLFAPIARKDQRPVTWRRAEREGM